MVDWTSTINEFDKQLEEARRTQPLSAHIKWFIDHNKGAIMGATIATVVIGLFLCAVSVQERKRRFKERQLRALAMERWIDLFRKREELVSLLRQLPLLESAPFMEVLVPMEAIVEAKIYDAPEYLIERAKAAIDTVKVILANKPKEIPS